MATSLVAGGRETQPHGSLDGDNLVAHSLRAEGFDASEDGTGRGTPLVAHPLTAREGKGPNSDADSGNLVAFDWRSGGDARGLDPKPTAQLQVGQTPAVAFRPTSPTGHQGDTCVHPSDASLALAAGGGNNGGGGGQVLCHPMAVRRLTPRECERLQGFPDDHTRIPYRDKPPSKCPDGPRYRALGNSFAVNVVRWLGERIQMVDDL